MIPSNGMDAGVRRKSKDEHSYSAQDIRLLQQQQERAGALLRVSQVASSSLVVDEVLQTIADEIVHATGAWCNAFLFPDRAKYGNYYFVNPFPPEGYQVPDPPDGLSLEALRTKKPVVARDVMTDPRTDKRTMEFFNLKSALAFPLLFQGNAVAAGFLSYEEDHEFTDSEIEWVMAIAGAAAMAVANARLHETEIQLALAHERNRIAQDVHDGFSQTLAAIKMNLNTMLFAKRLDKNLRSMIEKSKDLVDKAYDDAREAVYGFRLLGTTGSIDSDAFREYVQQFAERNDLTVDVAIDADDLGLINSQAMTQAICIISEALTNIRKHAQAKHVLVSTENDGSALTFCVEDDGVGIGSASAGEADGIGMGITIMRERAEEVQGSLVVEERKPHGTRIRFIVSYR